jgi:hypothetical protein
VPDLSRNRGCPVAQAAFTGHVDDFQLARHAGRIPQFLSTIYRVPATESQVLSKVRGDDSFRVRASTTAVCLDLPRSDVTKIRGQR